MDIDVTDCVSGTTVGWWAHPSDRFTTAPSQTILIADKQSFDASPADFTGYTGFWYNYDTSSQETSGLAFRVMEQKVHSCGTIFIGETDVDVSDCVSGGTIGWWVSPSLKDTTAPSKTIIIGDTRSFDASPADFTGYTGLWYNLDSYKPAHIAFNVNVRGPKPA